MAWNISKEKRRALVKLQLRDKHGRFVEMGNGVKWFSSLLGKEVSGEVVGGEGGSAVVRLNKDGGNKLVKVPAKNITVIDSKASLAPKEEKPEGQSYSKMTPQDKIAAAEKMYGTGSDQHKKAIEKFGQDADTTPDTATTPLTVSKTSDGNTYITAPEGAQLYTPAKELQIGDEIIAPDGADPLKPFSMGKAWATKDAERVNTQGPKIGKVVSIKENAYAVVQLPEGEMVPHIKTGEPQNSVTVGLSNNVIKATPELKEQLKDVIPEPVYSAPESSENGDVSSEDGQENVGSSNQQFEEIKQEIAALKAEIESSKEESSAVPANRDRQAIIDDLAPVDTSNWTKVGSQMGSNPGGVFEDENGQKWYVKQYKSDEHARAEVLADSLYRAAGIDAPG